MPRNTRRSLPCSFLKSPESRIAALLLAFSLCAPVHATEIYKWIDKDGVQHYSEQPPADGIKYETVNPHYTAPESPSDTSAKDAKQSNEDTANPQGQRQDQQQKSEAAKIRQQNCTTAQKRLEDLQSSPRISVKNPDGTVQRITEEERQVKITEAQELIKKYCD